MLVHDKSFVLCDVTLADAIADSNCGFENDLMDFFNDNVFLFIVSPVTPNRCGLQKVKIFHSQNKAIFKISHYYQINLDTKTPCQSCSILGVERK